MIVFKVLYLTCVSLTLWVTADQFDPSTYASKDVITRDVAVIGGGSTGTYAAVNLQYLGKSIVLVEKENVLGGHTNTYTDHATGITVDYGLQAFWNSESAISQHLRRWCFIDLPIVSVARAYFRLLDIETGPFQLLPNTRVFADFQSGKKVDNVLSTFNFTAYAAQLGKYPYLLYSWDLPNPIPEDLLISFGDFIKKYNLEDVAFDVFNSAEGVSNILSEPTVNVFKFIDESFLDTSSGNGIVPRSSNGEIYVKAATRLGKDVLLSSTVVAARRGGTITSLVVKTPKGNKLIRASKLLITIPPLLQTRKSPTVCYILCLPHLLPTMWTS